MLATEEATPPPVPATEDVVAPPPVPTAEDLIKAVQMQDLDRVKSILAAVDDTAPLVAVVPLGSGWGTHNEGALHAAIFGLKRHDATDRERTVWVEIIRRILAAGADPNAKYAQYDWRGCGESTTAFELILRRGALRDVELLTLFLDAGADARAAQVREAHTMRTDARYAHTPLHTAVAEGAVDCAIALVRGGADVDARETAVVQNERGFGENRSATALHVAVRQRSVEMSAMLLANGADVNAVSHHLHQESLGLSSPTNDPRDPAFVPSVRLVRVEQTALHIAIENGDADLVRLLVLHKANKTIEKSFGSVKTTPKALCAEHDAPELKERLQRALEAEWSPDTHKLFPEKFKAAVHTTLLTANRLEWSLPSDVLGQIFGNAA